MLQQEKLVRGILNLVKLIEYQLAMISKPLCSMILMTGLLLFSGIAQRITYSTSFLRYFSGAFSSSQPPIVLPTSSNGFYLVSDINYPPSNLDYNYLVLKLNSTGQLQQSASFTGAGSDALYDAVVGANDELVLLGYTVTPSQGVVITKLSSSLDVQSVITLTYSKLKDTKMRLILTQNQQHYIIAATATAGGKQHLYLSKMTTAGVEVWSVESSTAGIEPSFFQVRSLKELQNGNIIVGGRIKTVGAQEIFIFKVDPTGNKIWMKTFGATAQDFALNSIIEAKDQSGYFFTGYRKLLPNQELRIVVGKVNNDGSVHLALTQVSEQIQGKVIEETDDGRIIVAGNNQNTLTGIDFFLVTFDVSLVPNEARSIVRAGTDSIGGQLIMGSDGMLVMSGLNNKGEFIAELDSRLGLCSEFSVFEIQAASLPTSFTLSETNTVASYNLATSQYVTSSGFTMTKQVQSVTEQRSKERVCSVYDTLADMVILSPLNENECDCSFMGICDPVTGLCNCFGGYIGHRCQFLITELEAMRDSVNTGLKGVKAAYQTMSSQDALAQAKELTDLPDLVSAASGIECMNMVKDILSSSFSQENLVATYKVQSNLSQMALEDTVLAQKFSTQLTETNLNILTSNLGSISEISANLINVKVDSLVTSTGQPSSFSPSAAISVTIPSSASSCSGSTKTTAITYASNVYQHLTASEQRMVSDLASLNIFCDGQTESISNLSSPISIEFQISSSNSAAQEVLAKIASGEWTQQQVIDAGFFNCNYYDPLTQSFSSEGTRVVQIKTSSFVCETTHLTDFAPFFDSGAQVLLSSNYNVWYGLQYVTLDSLKTNVGFYVTFAYWGTLLILGVLCGIIDRGMLKVCFYQVLFHSTHPYKQVKKVKAVEKQIPEMHSEQVSIQPIDFHPFRITQNEGKGHLVLETTAEEIGITPKPSPKLNLDSTPSQSESPPKKKKRKSTCQVVQNRIQSSLVYNKKKRRCCCTCCCMAKNELTSNNQMFNVCCKTSPLYSRCTRLALIQLAILCDISICALFFDLEPHEAESLLFWENIVENIWVGLYSALIAIPVMLIVALSFHIPPSYMRRLEGTRSIKQVKEEYQKIAPRLRCQRACGFLLFFILSSFFCVYLIAFGELVRASSRQNWAQSSGASLMIDLIAFEIIPAFCVGSVALFSQCCCECKGWLCFLVTIEVYRLFRNIAA